MRIALALVAGTTTVYATTAADAAPKLPENVKLADKIDISDVKIDELADEFIDAIPVLLKPKL